MKLISKFHDYYDSVAYSDEPIFIRKMEILESTSVSVEITDKALEIMDKFRWISYFNKSKKVVLCQQLVDSLLCFCGKIYPVLQINSDLFCNLNKLNAYRDGEEIIISKSCFPFDKRNGVGSFEEHFKNIIQESNGNALAYDLNVALKTPIVLISKCRNLKIPTDRRKYIQYEVNSKLSLVNFQAVMTPWQTYQEIEMFLGTILVENQDKPAIMNDELKRDSKGFNEWSFKQVGPKKRKRRKK